MQIITNMVLWDALNKKSTKLVGLSDDSSISGMIQSEIEK